MTEENWPICDIVLHPRSREMRTKRKEERMCVRTTKLVLVKALRATPVAWYAQIDFRLAVPRVCAIAAILCLFGAQIAHAADLKIIANPNVGASSVSVDELKGVYLATKTSLSDGSHVEPVLQKEGPIHEAFLKEFVGKAGTALETYYRSLVFTGKAAMPRTIGSDADMVAYVAKTKGAIGYVSAGAASAGVKTLEVK